MNDVVRLPVDRLFRDHAEFVARFLFRIGVARCDIDDLVQEVFLVAHRKGGFRELGATPRTWLAAIALRIALASKRTARRSLQRYQPIDDDELSRMASEQEDPEAAAEIAEELILVQAALDGLDVEKRAVMILHELEEQTSDAIAAALGVPVGTVFSRLHRARQEFVARFERLRSERRKP